MNSLQPRISVIMGIYNCASTLQEALNSLYNQTFQDFEIILCDDGSIDETFSIAQSNVKIHSNIVLLKNTENKGLNYTLNRCLKTARGEYIARMDGDDISLPTRFEKEILFLDSHPEFGIVSTVMTHFDSIGDFRMGTSTLCPIEKDFINGTPFCHAPCMVRKQAYDDVNGYSESPRLLRVEDYHLWFKMYAHGYRGYNLQEPLYKMRDDRNAYVRRKYKYRVNEAYVKWIGYRMLKLPAYYVILALRPLIIGLLPECLYNLLHRR